MNEEIKRVLDMLEEGKISKDDAVKLIEALKESKVTETSAPEKPAEKRKFHLIADKGDGKKVDITIPTSVLKFGLTIAKKLGKSTINIDGNEIPIDIDKINEVLKDPDFSGKVMEVSDGEKKVIIEIV